MKRTSILSAAFFVCMLCSPALAQGARKPQTANAASESGREGPARPEDPLKRMRAEIAKLKATYDARLAEMQRKLEQLRKENEAMRGRLDSTLRVVTPKGGERNEPAKNQRESETNAKSGSEVREDGKAAEGETGAEGLELESEIEALLKSEAAAERKTTEGQAPPPTLQLQPSASRSGAFGAISQSMMNPNISAIGDITAIRTRNDRDRLGIEEEGGPPLGDRFSLRETELVFETYADPYAKGFIDLSASDIGEEGEDLEIEEGYLTWFALPYNLTAKAGKFRTDFGKINTTHTHALPQVDRPKVITDFFGPEGLIGRGLSLSWLTPLPWYSEVLAQVINGENEASFAGVESDNSALVAHTKNFFEIGDASNLEVGGSYALGANDARGDRLTQLWGLDLTYKWKPPDKPYKSFTWQTEFIFSRIESPAGISGLGDGDFASLGEDTRHTSGFYTFAEYQLSRRLYGGLRFDYTERPALESGREWALSPYLTFYESEFVRLRLQYQHVARNFEDLTGDDILYLQATFSLGPHGAHPF